MGRRSAWARYLPWAALYAARSRQVELENGTAPVVIAKCAAALPTVVLVALRNLVAEQAAEAGRCRTGIVLNPGPVVAHVEAQMVHIGAAAERDARARKAQGVVQRRVHRQPDKMSVEEPERGRVLLFHHELDPSGQQREGVGTHFFEEQRGRLFLDRRAKPFGAGHRLGGEE